MKLTIGKYGVHVTDNRKEIYHQQKSGLNLISSSLASQALLWVVEKCLIHLMH